MAKSGDKTRRVRFWGWAAIILLLLGFCWSIGLMRSRPDRVVVNPATAETLKDGIDEGNRRNEFLSSVAREIEVLKEREGEVSKKLPAERSDEISVCRSRLQRVENEILRARRNGAVSERMMLETRQELSSIAGSLGELEF